MGKRGPKKTSTATLRLHGSWRANTRRDEPQPVAGTPTKPEWLVGEAAAEWKRQVLDLKARLLLAKSYRVALVMYCQAWGTWVDACKFINENGPTTTTDKGNVLQHPLVAVRNKAFEQVIKLGAQFGFSPGTQADLHVQPPEETDDEFEEFLRRKEPVAKRNRHADAG